MENNRTNIILDKTLKFSLDIIRYCEILESERKYVIAKQLLKSGTSIGANTFEAKNAESKNDFIHKFKIAAKEVDETYYWLEICKEINSYPFDQSLIDELDSISRIINKIISSSKTSQTLQSSN